MDEKFKAVTDSAVNLAISKLGDYLGEANAKIMEQREQDHKKDLEHYKMMSNSEKERFRQDIKKKSIKEWLSKENRSLWIVIINFIGIGLFGGGFNEIMSAVPEGVDSSVVAFVMIGLCIITMILSITLLIHTKMNKKPPLAIAQGVINDVDRRSD